MVTISFNLAPGVSLGEATKAIEHAEQEIRLPASDSYQFSGHSRRIPNSLSPNPADPGRDRHCLYRAGSFVRELHSSHHNSFHTAIGWRGRVAGIVDYGQRSRRCALIGIILLIGIVKKNAIMMIDFALEAEREEHKEPEEAIYQACLLRFRPIMMTTMAALFGGLPLALAAALDPSAASAGYHDCRRPACQPIADPVYDSGCLSLV